MRIRCSNVQANIDAGKIDTEMPSTGTPYARDGGYQKKTEPTFTDWFLKCREVHSDKRDKYAPSPDYLECSNYKPTESANLNSTNTHSRTYDSSRPDSQIPSSLAVTVGTPIHATDFNNLRDKVKYLNSGLLSEVNQRNRHTYYGGLNITVDAVGKGDIINYNSQANLTKIVAQMKSIVKQKSDYYQEDAYIMNASKVGTGNEIVTTDLNDILVDTQNLNKDCICFSDCYNFTTIATKYCVCNINCQCNYG